MPLSHLLPLLLSVPGLPVVRESTLFYTFIDRYFEDTDVAFLFDDRYDGLDETEVAQMLGFSSLAFADWFLPFSDAPSRVVHPYVLEV